MYTIDKMKVKRIDKRRLELEIGGQKQKVFTEDLAALVRAELPKDRATELFSEMETVAMQRGKARVVVKSHKDLKAGEEVCFTIDVSKYSDGSGVRVSPNGIIF